jgi:DNA-binding protein H-NS
MLLNEFLKEHRKVEEQETSMRQLKSTVAKQEAIIAEQQKGLQTVIARLEQQAAQIQKVSAQLAQGSPSDGALVASKFATGRIRGEGPAPQVVNNP